MTTKKTRKRAAKPKAKAEEPQVAPPETEGTIEEAQPLPFEPRPFGVIETKEPPSQLDVPADGTLIRQDGQAVVYVMREGQRRPFTTPEAFVACGFGWGDIVVLPPKEVDPIPVGQDVTGASDL